MRREKLLEQQLVHLALVDIAGGLNKHLKTGTKDDNLIQLDDNFERFKNNFMLFYIVESPKSFRLVQDIIRISAPNFLKPYQLSTVMSYAETMFHSNDYQFMALMADVLGVVKK